MHFGNGSSAIRCILCVSVMDQWKSCQFYLLRQWIINNFIYLVYFDPVNCERALTKCKVGNSANTRTAKGLLLTESTSHQGPDTWYQVPGTTHLLPGNMYQVQCTRYLVSGTTLGTSGCFSEGQLARLPNWPCFCMYRLPGQICIDSGSGKCTHTAYNKQMQQ